MTSAQPGTPIKVQEDVNLSQNYTLPPSTAVSRFIYVSESLSGEHRPVSGYVLWPYLPGLDANGGDQIVAWAHSTSGTQSRLLHPDSKISGTILLLPTNWFFKVKS
ncbi:uncharacterized protein EAF01_005686 [Botrytis porri]|uniref:uncharacterized protein n=1 Tax=Botrytis porri TaxID=87229 RepID=UPI00190243A3|nr:uncharacterized protein EAF01_005686 [Botrytis porri]KAF7905165.1 hypothetical protein EAF01_005686 [Botrytis porri]